MSKPACGNCGMKFTWDWEQDTYRAENGISAEEEQVPKMIPTLEALSTYHLNFDTTDLEMFTPMPTDPAEVTLFRCPICQAIIGAYIHHEDVGAVVAKRADWPSWHNVNWEQYAWDSQT